ncbi:hypothetical protein [Thiolapillus sp.]|uniref:hypothetical protein n=1 Tax=Thiolapillus sp. TaxID=2017437 RepID=UPI0025EE6DBC|nr:hypothetical protein [Thiolapillus sp.]
MIDFGTSQSPKSTRPSLSARDLLVRFRDVVKRHPPLRLISGKIRVNQPEDAAE